MTHLEIKVSVGDSTTYKVFAKTAKGNIEAERYLKKLGEARTKDDFYKLEKAVSVAVDALITAETKFQDHSPMDAYSLALRKSLRESIEKIPEPPHIKVEINHIVKDDKYIKDLL